MLITKCCYQRYFVAKAKEIKMAKKNFILGMVFLFFAVEFVTAIDILDRNYRVVGQLNGNTIKDAYYRTIGTIDGNTIKDAYYRTIGTINGNTIKDANYRTIAQVNGSPVQVKMVALLIFFFFYLI
jgi:hypothetical protein